MHSKITPRALDFSAWYGDVIREAGLAERSPSRGSMIIKPHGFALWERIQSHLDKELKKTGHLNAYFPLLLPASYLSKEAKHVEGFAKECAVVTHYKLCKDPHKGGLMPDPTSILEEPLIIRPTSETIIWDAYRRWIQSYRDLPLLINQWANVVRMEMRTRPFLRTREILWQEGHTAHATKEEAIKEAENMQKLYAQVAREFLALPTITGIKTAHEKFAGAEITYTLESLMQDGKALQLGTSHFLGQNFAKAFDVSFTNAKGVREYVWGTSWGITTRLIGALIMVHGDDQGLRLPPSVAPTEVILLPMYHPSTSSTEIESYLKKIQGVLQEEGIRVQIDLRREQQAGWKFHHYEAQGIPLQLIVGGKEMAKKCAEVRRRDNGKKESYPLTSLRAVIPALLREIQKKLYEEAFAFQQEKIHEAKDFTTFQEILTHKRGFIRAWWDGESTTEEAIKKITKATIRCIPHEKTLKAVGKDLFSGKEGKEEVLFALAY